MKRKDILHYVAYVVDDTLNGREYGQDENAVVKSNSVLVGWQCGFEPMFVSVHSYMGHRLSDDDAVEIATDYLDEKGWFHDGPTEPDFIL